MSNFDNQLDRMKFLMGYDNTINESKKTNSGIEYHTTGADGKEYGIIREGLYYYIKTTTPDKKELCESYDYINGHQYRGETRYRSYNDATRQLELRLMSLNEAKGIHKDVTVANMNASKEAFEMLTEASRKELNRMHNVFESSFVEKGKGTGFGSVGDGAPFETEAKPEMDKDHKETKKDGKVCCGNTVVSDAEKNLTSANAPKCKDGECKNEKATVDIDGECVATKECGSKKKPVTGKINEGETDIDTIINGDENLYDVEDIADDTMMDDNEIGLDIEDDGEGIDTDINVEDDVEAPIDDDETLVGDDEASELDDILREYEEIYFGDNKTLTGKKEGTLPAQTCDTVEKKPTVKCGENGCEETMKGNRGSLPVQTCDRLNEGKKKVNMKKVNEAVDRITDKVYDNMMMESIKKMVKGLVKEEVTRLNDFGKHPRYRKAPMTLPDNHEVMRGTADRDCNDESAKGNAPYGSRIGSSAPFEDTVEKVTARVLAVLKEGAKEKK